MGNQTQITVLGCANATGQTIPPTMVVFSGKQFLIMNRAKENEVSGTLFGMSDSESELFSSWFSNHMLFLVSHFCLFLMGIHLTIPIHLK